MLRYIFLALLALPASAHEFVAVQIDTIDDNGSYVTAHLSGTVKGERIVCAIYSAEGKVIGSRRTSTANLASAIRIPYETGTPARVTCVRDE